MIDIQTEFDEVVDPEKLDNGVEKEVHADETFVREGERIEQHTTVAFLEDGGIHITQRIQDMDVYDSLTLSDAVARRVQTEQEADR